ncbi:hypothetical protein [Castellaniella sp. MT123]
MQQQESCQPPLSAAELRLIDLIAMIAARQFLAEDSQSAQSNDNQQETIH